MRWGYKLALTGEATFLGINFGKGASHTGKKFGMKKRWVGVIRMIRKKTEIFRRRLREFLMKKGCEKGMVSL